MPKLIKKMSKKPSPYPNFPYILLKKIDRVDNITIWMYDNGVLGSDNFPSTPLYTHYT